MKAIEILYNLSPYQTLLEELYEKACKEKADLGWKKSLSSQYSFITLELKTTPKDDPKARGELAVQIKFEIQRDKVVLSEVYCEEKSKTEEIEKTIKANKRIHDAQWHTEPNNTWYHDEVVTAYINVADEIAQESYNCNPGDNYHPGNFSEIEVNGTEIILSQINLHNSRSSAHKEDYHMRKLFFHIPLTAKEPETDTFEDNYQIGNMIISFSDHSSEKNRGCGKKIVEQILQQQAGFSK